MSATHPISRVLLVSDGILVEFASGVRCYFPAEFLLNHLADGSNQVFLDHDPSAAAESALAELPLVAASTALPRLSALPALST